jgi:hypothetical protein
MTDSERYTQKYKDDAVELVISSGRLGCVRIGRSTRSGS